MEGGNFPKLPGLKLVSQGKVRDIYEVDDYSLLLVATDRVSAYDVVLKTPIKDKGKILTQMSLFWSKMIKCVKYHLITTSVDEMPEKLHLLKSLIDGRSMLVKKLKIIPLEFIVRGYLSGSAWKEYKEHGTVNFMPLPSGLVECSKLEHPLYTPSTKEDSNSGKHDTPVTEKECERILGSSTAQTIKEYCMNIYSNCAEYAASKGIIIADTKFEFGFDSEDQLCLADEILTPDSSRFWSQDTYAHGRAQESYDKQYIRDYLERVNFDKKHPVALPDDVVEVTSHKYRTAYEILTGNRWS